MHEEERKAAIDSMNWSDVNLPVDWKKTEVKMGSRTEYSGFVVYRGVVITIHIRMPKGKEFGLHNTKHFVISPLTVPEDGDVNKKNKQFDESFWAAHVCYDRLEDCKKTKEAGHPTSEVLPFKEKVVRELAKKFDYVDFLLDGSEEDFKKLGDSLLMTLKNVQKKIRPLEKIHKKR